MASLDLPQSSGALSELSCLRAPSVLLSLSTSLTLKPDTGGCQMQKKTDQTGVEIVCALKLCPPFGKIAASNQASRPNAQRSRGRAAVRPSHPRPCSRRSVPETLALPLIPALEPCPEALPKNFAPQNQDTAWSAASRPCPEVILLQRLSLLPEVLP